MNLPAGLLNFPLIGFQVLKLLLLSLYDALDRADGNALR